MSISDICWADVFYSLSPRILCSKQYKDKWKDLPEQQIFILIADADTERQYDCIHIRISVVDGSRLQRRCLQSRRRREHQVLRVRRREGTQTEEDHCLTLLVDRALPRWVKLSILLNLTYILSSFLCSFLASFLSSIVFFASSSYPPSWCPSTYSPPGGSSRWSSPSDVPAHLQRERKRPHPRLQLQPVQALARRQSAI